MNDTNPAADFSLWYYYMKQQSSRRAYIRIAAGIASLAWANSAAVSENGTSITGNDVDKWLIVVGWLSTQLYRTPLSPALK